MSAELIHQMYIAYYQRPADPAGLIYWQDQLNANGGGEAGWNAVSAAFANAAESSALYGNQTLAQKISAIYLAAFERAASADEVAYWEASGFNAAQIGFAIVNGAQNDDLRTVDKKVDYSEAFVSTLDPAGTGVGPFAFQYVDPSLGRGLMDVITKDSNVSAATVSSQVSSTLPTLVTVNLTSGADTVTPTANAAEEINAALGGSSPSLDRTDTIDGGSAQDTINVAMDGNFLLGFSSGTMRDVEIVNIAATASSVTPKTFNFTGSSGIETINVGAANAPIIVSNISDTGLTLNLSGQSSGTFDVGFATGTISGSGSSLTVGVTDVGSTGTNVSLTANLITELDIVSYGTSNHITLDSSVNDIQNISVAGAGDLVIGGVPSTASGFTAASAGGDVTLTVDTDTNTVMLASGQTISGGAGFDSLSIQGSGIAAAASSSIEELIFDGSTSEAIVRATGMAGLNTLTFSGQGANVPSISGIGDQALTVNATLDSTSDRQQTISGSGAVTVNLKGNPTQVALENRSDNDFDFKASTTAGVDINVGPYVSSSGTYVMNNSTGSVGITVDSTSIFGSHVQASGAQTITILGNGGIAATVSGQNTQTITVNASSGSLAVGSSAANTFTLNTTGNIEVNGSNSRLSGVQTLTINTATGTADLSGSKLGFQDAQTVVLGGAGTGATVLLNTLSGSASNMALSITGLEGGVSAGNIHANSGNLTIGGEAMTGEFNVTSLKVSGAGSMTVSTGTAGQFSAGTTNAAGTFTLDASANTSGSSSITLTTFSASGAVAISAGSGSGDISLASIEGESTFTLDASNFGGTIDVGTLTAGGNITVSMGTEGYFSASVIGTNGTLTLDGAASSTGQVTTQVVSAGGGITVSMGTGSGGITMVSSVTNGNFTIDASNFGGSIDTSTITASGAVVVSMGSLGDYSAQSIATQGAFTLDGAVASSGSVVLSSVTAGGNFTVSMGSGTGSLAVTNGVTLGNMTIDASNFGGSIDATTLTASGAVTVSLGSLGDFSASDIAGAGNITFDGAAATTGQMTISTLTAGGNFTISMGAGTGALALTSADVDGSVTIDASNFGGSMDILGVTASGAVVVSLGSAGNFSAGDIDTTGGVTIDGAGAATGAVTLTAVSASGAVTFSMGSGSGSVSVGNMDSEKGITIDASKFLGTVDMTQVTASGASTIAVGGGDYSAGAAEFAGNFTFDGSTSTTGSFAFTVFSAGGNASITLGGGSGSITMTSADVDGSFTLDASNNSGTMDVQTLTASGAVTFTLDGGDRGAFSAAQIDGNSITVSQTEAGSGALSVNGMSASGNITVSLGTGTGSANITVSGARTDSGFSLTGDQNGDVTLNNISASASITVNMGGNGSLAASALVTDGALSITKALGAGESMDLQKVSAVTSLGITLGAASGNVSASVVSVGSFTFDASSSTENTSAHHIGVLSAQGTTNVTLGTANGFNASAITINSAGGTFTKGAGSADFTVAVGISSEGALTINGAGTGSFTVSVIDTAGGFTFNGENMATGGQYFSANIISNSSGAVTLNYGNGGNAFLGISAVDSASAFSLIGTNLTTGNFTITNLSATEAITMDFGGMSGSAVVSTIQTDGAFTLNAGNASNLALNIESVSASAASITLGAVSQASHANDISAINVTNTFTLNGSGYREIFNNESLSASAVTITFGDLSDAAAFSSLNAVNLTFNGGDGASFSADFTDIGVTGADWSITMPELGNSLQIDNIAFGKSGTITGTNMLDTVSASSTTAAGDTLKFEFNLGEDSQNDVFAYSSGAGKELVKIYNFKQGGDDLKTTVGDTADSTSIGTTTAASILSGALGASIAASDVTGASATATFVYNGDLFFLGISAGAALNGTFEDREVVFQFVGITDITGTDIAGY